MTRALRTFALLSLLLSAATLHAAANVGLYKEFFVGTPADPGAKTSYSAMVTNAGPDAAQDVVVTMPLPAGATFAGNNDVFGTRLDCSEAGGIVTCRTASIPAVSNATFSFSIIAPPSLAGGTFATKATVTSSSPDSDPTNNELVMTLVVYRTFIVASRADAGAGTLRAQLLEANGNCNGETPCKVRLDLPADSLIEPLSPLPIITACNLTVTPAIVRNPPEKPAVTLNGSQAGLANGFSIRGNGCSSFGVSIANFEIVRFSQNGVAIIGGNGHHAVGRSLIRENGSRGVYVDSSNVRVDLTANVVRDNYRSGLFVQSAADVYSTSNVYSGNGASGIYTRGNTTLSADEIAGNRQFAVGTERGARRLRLNATIYGNGAGIDRGMDGVNDAGAPDIPARPIITGATYDAATNRTTISIAYPQFSPFGSFIRVAIYASSSLDAGGRAQAERLVSGVEMGPGRSVTAVANGDLRGQILSARADVYVYGDSIDSESSELSEPFFF